MDQLFNDGAFPFRVNTTGTYDPATGKFRASNATKGVSDVLASYQGRLLALEVKIGSDKQRPEQVGFQKNIEYTKSVYLIVKTFEQFLLDWNKIKVQIDAGRADI